LEPFQELIVLGSLKGRSVVANFQGRSHPATHGYPSQHLKCIFGGVIREKNMAVIWYRSSTLQVIDVKLFYLLCALACY